MRKNLILTLSIAITLMTACSSEDPLSEDNNYSNMIDGSISGGSSSGNSTTSSYAEMASFTVAIDKTTAEPESTAAAQYPEDSDAPSARHNRQY